MHLPYFNCPVHAYVAFQIRDEDDVSHDAFLYRLVILFDMFSVSNLGEVYSFEPTEHYGRYLGTYESLEEIDTLFVRGKRKRDGTTVDLNCIPILVCPLNLRDAFVDYVYPMSGAHRPFFAHVLNAL